MLSTQNIVYKHIVLQVRNPLEHIASRGVITAPTYVDSHAADGMPPGPEVSLNGQVLHRARENHWQSQASSCAQESQLQVEPRADGTNSRGVLMILIMGRVYNLNLNSPWRKSIAL